jgi:putative transposase
MLRASRSPRAAYYAAKKRPPSRRSLADAALAETIEATFWDREKGRGVYGARKMWHQLRRDGVIGPAGRPIARCTVERLMRELGLRGARRGRPVLTTRADRRSERAPDLVDRNFTAAAPNRLWVVDLTYVPTWSGMVFTAFVSDVFSRRIVGWRCATSMPTQLPPADPRGTPPTRASAPSTPWRWLYGPAKQQVTPARDDWTG